MVSFRSPDQLAHELEMGIGIDGTYYEAIDPELRLRLPVSDLASYALAKVLREAGNEVSIMQSRPHFVPGPQQMHVFSVIHDASGDTIVDPTYSSLLSLAGLTAESVMLGNDDLFPKEKIITFRPEARAIIAVELTNAARKVLSLTPPENTPPRTSPMKGMSLVTMKYIFSEVWNPDSWSCYRPPHDLREAGRKASAAIHTDSVRFIA